MPTATTPPTNPHPHPHPTPSLTTYLQHLKSTPAANIETSIAHLISLLQRRQIRHSRPCALATAQLLLRVVAAEKRVRDPLELIARVREVGRRLVAAQPRELAVGNIVRRVLGVIREVVEEEDAGGGGREGGDGIGMMGLREGAGGAGELAQDLQSRPRTPVSPPHSSDGAEGRKAALLPATSTSSYAGAGAAAAAPPPPQVPSLLSLLEELPQGKSSPAGTPPPTGTQSPTLPKTTAPKSGEKLDLKAEVLDGIKELLDELSIVDTQIAESALDHIHSNETLLTHSSSQTVQKFLRAAAAKKRKFTVVHAEAWPNEHRATHAMVLHGSSARASDDNDGDVGREAEEQQRWKPLTSMGITVILIPDTAVFALMSRINKVLLAPHAILANGSLLARAGTSTICLAAKSHNVPVVVLAGIYKLSPVYPFDPEALVEYGDPGKVVGFEEGELVEKVRVLNPVFDWVGPDMLDLFVTNLGGCAPSFLYRIVADH